MRTLKEVAISSFMAFLKNNGFHVPTIAEERLVKQHNEVKKGGRQKGPKIQKQPGRCFSAAVLSLSVLPTLFVRGLSKLSS